MQNGRKEFVSLSSSDTATVVALRHLYWCRIQTSHSAQLLRMMIILPILQVDGLHQKMKCVLTMLYEAVIIMELV